MLLQGLLASGVVQPATAVDGVLAFQREQAQQAQLAQLLAALSGLPAVPPAQLGHMLQLLQQAGLMEAVQPQLPAAQQQPQQAALPVPSFAAPPAPPKPTLPSFAAPAPSQLPPEWLAGLSGSGAAPFLNPPVIASAPLASAGVTAKREPASTQTAAASPGPAAVRVKREAAAAPSAWGGFPVTTGFK
jgi:hypothetical protein